MENQNISFVVENQKFNFRVAAFITYKNKVLLETSSNFWNMPGGRVQMGESSFEAITRELDEEMGVVADNCKLVRVCENFFEWMGNHQQEMLFIYKVELDETSELVQKDNFKCKDSDKLTFKWHNFEDVAGLNCLPKCIYDLVKEDNNGVKHEISKS